ncbi:MAG: hypothetical protein LPK03_07075, partial [Pontibacter sp.]|nr:hypothetical protein [Pontibacter sp.]
MRQNKSKSKTLKWLKVGAWIVGVALLLFVGLFFFTYWLEGKLERMVSERSNGVYTLELYGFDVSPFIGTVSVDSLSLVPDYQRWEQVQQQNKKAPRMLLDVQSGPIGIRNLNTFGILFGNDINLNELSL